jgi:hypothetical protein
MARSGLSTGVFTTLLLAAAAALAGCSSSHLIADNLPAAVGGLPENVPARPETAPAFPPVHSQPPSRADAMLSEAERKKLKDELIATRDRAARQTHSSETIKTTENIKQAKKTKKIRKKAEKVDPVATGSTPAAGSAANP